MVILNQAESGLIPIQFNVVYPGNPQGRHPEARDPNEDEAIELFQDLVDTGLLACQKRKFWRTFPTLPMGISGPVWPLPLTESEGLYPSLRHEAPYLTPPKSPNNRNAPASGIIPENSSG